MIVIQREEEGKKGVEGGREGNREGRMEGNFRKN